MSARTLARRFALGASWLVFSPACKGTADEPTGVVAPPVAAPLAAVTPSAAASNRAVVPPPPATEPCVTACARSRELHCPGAKDCETTCAALRDSDPCGAEMRAALGCFVAQPASSWECGEDGMAAIREGFCIAPQQRVVDCLSASGAH